MIPGILSLQGGYEAHGRSLERLGLLPLYVKTLVDLERCHSLIIPGGESTVMIKLLKRNHMLEVLKRKILGGFPVFGTCAGMILLSNGIDSMEQETLKAMDFQVQRNAYGRQKDSFECQLHWQGSKVEAIFIRAPKITAYKKEVEVLLEYGDSPVLVRQNNCLAASFHPELTENPWAHRFFMDELVMKNQLKNDKIRLKSIKL